MIKGYVLIQTQVGRAHEVAGEIVRIKGVLAAEGVTGPYDVIVEAEAAGLDDLSRLVVMRIQEVDGVTRTLTCPVVHL
jgi:DNA-binding Lrp family transcriptional regulator